MRLVVGLGNYPEKYARTRHNFGFLALERLAAKYDFGPFKLEAKFKASLSYGEIKGEKTILCKPHTLMNLSGEAVGAIMKFYKISRAQLWVLSDDLDQDFGACRLREKGSDGGQKGLRHISLVLGSNEYHRLKFGISNDHRDGFETDRFVLGKFTSEEWGKLPSIVDEGIGRLEMRW